ncbi:MAG: quinolinate synthase NadA [Ruminococcaceae bacterium]|nr:quinolinate synthase NadA [Oscillospiraceae bacterium]MBR3596450.1 quinolinate synthase NadA [Clostridia bacterium]
MNKEVISEIKRLKEETGTLILAHTYQAPEIIELADITGDSFALAKKSLSAGAKRVIMCGVRFMAESVKILSPDTEVILPEPDATCPMAEMISPERVRRYKEENPEAVVVAYINTTAALKAECDVCVTSSSALKIVEQLDAPEILFIPDKNLGSFVKEHFPDKNIVLWDGYCPVHAQITEEDILKAKKEHPEALLAVHPECSKDVVKHSDMAGSTAEIIDFALKSDKPVIIGTERGVADYLIPKHPEKKFYHLCPDKLVCRDMKYTTPESILKALRNEGGEKIRLPEELIRKAKHSIDEMLRLG